MYALDSRARLASFEHAYNVALQRRRATSTVQMVVRTANPLQPYRATEQPDEDSEETILLVL